jgi:hypothetical protein
VQVVGTVDGWDFLGVATAVASWVLIVDLGGSMERLVNVSNVVDDQAESERLLVFLIAEGISDLLVVGGRLVVTSVHQEVGQSRESLHNVSGLDFEVRVVRDRATIIQVRSVDEVPLRLPAVALAFDVVGKGGALREWVAVFHNKVWVVRLEWLESINSSLKSRWVLLLQDSLGSSRN